jgi:hypothetical protein
LIFSGQIDRHQYSFEKVMTINALSIGACSVSNSCFLVFCRLLAVSFIVATGLSACASNDHIEPYRDVACFERAAVSLSEAIIFAQGARNALVIDAEYNCQEELGCLSGNPGGYDITYYDNGRLDRVNVCPVTGAVRPPLQRSGLQRIAGLDFLFDWPESEMTRAAPIVASAPVSMLEAVGNAESARGLKAMASHVKTEGGKTYYAIELVDSGRIYLALVDPATGTVQE